MTRVVELGVADGWLMAFLMVQSVAVLALD